MEPATLFILFAAAIGLSQSGYSFLESGLMLPSPQVMERLCRLFKCSIEELYPDERVQSFYR